MMDIKILEADDVLNFTENNVIIITCIKIIPLIIFELPSGQLLTSVQFDSCRSFYDSCVYLRCACFHAHKMLKASGVDGYGTNRSKLHPLLDTYGEGTYECIRRTEPPYDFYLDDQLLELHGILPDPEYGNITIVAVPKEIRCNFCAFTQKLHGPLRNGETREVYSVPYTHLTLPTNSEG